jgi:hypothetical protein
MLSAFDIEGRLDGPTSGAVDETVLVEKDIESSMFKLRLSPLLPFLSNFLSRTKLEGGI